MQKQKTVCSLLVAAVSVAAQLYIPILCGDAIDKMLGKGNVDLGGVMRIAVEVLVVAAVAALAQWLLSVCNNRITFLGQPRPAQRGPAQDPDPAAVLSGQPPLRRHREPHGGRCGTQLCGWLFMLMRHHHRPAERVFELRQPVRQKQLLCIARVMLCLPPMLILDEATFLH